MMRWRAINLAGANSCRWRTTGRCQPRVRCDLQTSQRCGVCAARANLTKRCSLVPLLRRRTARNRLLGSIPFIAQRLQGQLRGVFTTSSIRPLVSPSGRMDSAQSQRRLTYYITYQLRNIRIPTESPEHSNPKSPTSGKALAVFGSLAGAGSAAATWAGAGAAGAGVVSINRAP